MQARHAIKTLVSWQFLVYAVKAKNILEEADDKARELLEVFLAAELGVEQHHKVAGVGLGRTGLRSKSIS